MLVFNVNVHRHRLALSVWPVPRTTDRYDITFDHPGLIARRRSDRLRQVDGTPTRMNRKGRKDSCRCGGTSTKVKMKSEGVVMRFTPPASEVGRDRRWLLLSVVAVVAAVGAFVWSRQASERTNAWSETTGHVVEVHRRVRNDSDGGRKVDWDTTIRFTDGDGIAYSFRSEHGSSKTREGDPVTVKYPPRDPERAQTSEDIRERVMFRLVIGLFALVAAGWATGRAFGWWGYPWRGTASTRSPEHETFFTPRSGVSRP